MIKFEITDEQVIIETDLDIEVYYEDLKRVVIRKKTPHRKRITTSTQPSEYEYVIPPASTKRSGLVKVKGPSHADLVMETMREIGRPAPFGEIYQQLQAKGRLKTTAHNPYNAARDAVRRDVRFGNKNGLWYLVGEMDEPEDKPEIDQQTTQSAHPDLFADWGDGRPS
jgi:hypothetical protein